MHFDNPSTADIRDILKYALRSVPLSSDADISSIMNLIDKSMNLSASGVIGICSEALNTAIYEAIESTSDKNLSEKKVEKVCIRHFRRVIESSQPSVQRLPHCTFNGEDKLAIASFTHQKPFEYDSQEGALFNQGTK